MSTFCLKNSEKATNTLCFSLFYSSKAPKSNKLAPNWAQGNRAAAAAATRVIKLNGLELLVGRFDCCWWKLTSRQQHTSPTSSFTWAQQQQQQATNRQTERWQLTLLLFDLIGSSSSSRIESFSFKLSWLDFVRLRQLECFWQIKLLLLLLRVSDALGASIVCVSFIRFNLFGWQHH